MDSRFFIDRPVFASVIAIVVVLAGLVAYRALPVARFPEVAPPTVKVKAMYPGADARTVSETVAQPIEEEINGVEGMLYMSSTCSGNGEYALDVIFESGTDGDMAAVRVQNRVSMAEAKLPEAVRRQGVTTKKASSSMIFGLSLISPDGRYDDTYLGNYAALELRDELARLPGVGEVEILGPSAYAMRIWLDPGKLQARGLSGADVARAIREQNVQVAAGQLGQPPQPSEQAFQYTVHVKGRLTDPEEFGAIVVKGDPEAGLVRVRDVARVELGIEQYDVSSRLFGRPSVLLAIYRLPGANLVEVIDRVQAKLAELEPAYPEGLEHYVALDMSRFVRASIGEVKKTLLITAALVVFVIVLFLQNWRASVIPAITIPVSLIGTFSVMALLGFSINMVTLFGLVLAIGIVVDNDIVVVENTMRHIEAGLEPKEAAIRAMREGTSPIIAMTLVLMAVFVPVAFVGGITGGLYRQFALTIAASAAFSGINALTLSPALCALFLKKPKGRKNPFSRAFNSVFAKTTRGYTRFVGMVARRSAIAFVLYLALAGAGVAGFLQLPTGFVPNEDEGVAFMHVQLPDGASRERVLEVIEELEVAIESVDGVEYAALVNGLSLFDGAPASNYATAVISLDHWSLRRTPELQLDAVVARLWEEARAIEDAHIVVFTPPPIVGIGIAGGFKLELEDRGGVGYAALAEQAAEMARLAEEQPTLGGVFTSFRASTPQRFLDIDRDKVKRLGIPLSAVFGALETNVGTYYVNDFNRFGKTYQVRLQDEPSFRDEAEDIGRLRVPLPGGRAVPLSTLLEVREEFGPSFVKRHNMYPCASIGGMAIRGASSGDALALMESIAEATLPPTMDVEWTEMSFQERRSSGQAGLLLLLSVAFVFLVLCAQYEDWFLPLAVILAVPFGLLGTVIAVLIGGMSVNVYVQIGLVMLIALASKNAILIVEFARELRAQGKSIIAAAVEAARLRFRPVLMTAFTFILGAFPLVIASGAGAVSRRAIGSAVFGGMLAATILGVVFVPAFFVLLRSGAERLFRRRFLPQSATPGTPRS